MIGENISLQPLGNKYNIYVSKNHTFGTDAVLLADFANPKRNETMVDLGTGCGIIPMLMLRDNKVSSAFGLEISKEAVLLAEETIKENNLSARFKVFEGDIKFPFEHLQKGAYSLVTCNPPYKASGAGILSETKTDKVARHETLCNLEDVIKAAAGLLTYGGRFAICQRPERLGEIISLMSANEIEPKLLRLVTKKEGAEPWLVLVMGRLKGGKGMRVMPNLNVYNSDGNLSEEMLKIYGPYKQV